MLTTKEIMVNILLNVMTLTSDVEPVDTISVVADKHYQEQIYCLALNSYFETRGEGFSDKVSVAQSVMYRVEDDKEFKSYHTPCEVVTKAYRDKKGNVIANKCWYSWYCDGVPDRPQIYFKNGAKNILEYKAWQRSVLAAFYAYHGIYPDLIKKATHYYNDKLANPHWATAYNQVAKVGKHVFLSDS